MEEVKLPLYRSFIPTDSIPWKQINADLDRGDTDYRDVEKGVTTAGLGLRVDLEPWASGYKSAVIDVVNRFIPSSIKQEYNSWTDMHWINRTCRDGHVRKHIHYPCDLAVVWYLDIPERSGHFVMHFDNKDHVIPVSTGDFIAFPGSILHYSQPSQTDSPRYVMASNVLWTESTLYSLRDKLSNHEINSYIEKVFYERQEHLIRDMMEKL